MKRIILLVVVMMVALSAGVIAEETTQAENQAELFSEDSRFRQVMKDMSGEQWLSWSDETKAIYTIAYFSALREANFTLLGSDPDGIGRLFSTELGQIMLVVNEFYKRNPDDRGYPLYRAMKDAFQAVVYN